MATGSGTVGGPVLPNLIVGGQFWEVAGVALDLAGSRLSADTTSAALVLFGFGLNVTYYFMPANVFVSATPSIGTLVLARDLRLHDTDPGFALRLAAGKEWWVSDNWGLGVTLQYAYGSNSEKDGGSTWRTNALGVAFSATFN